MVGAFVFRYPQRQEKDVTSLGAGVTSSSEFLDMGIRTQTHVLEKSRKCSQLLGCLSSLRTIHNSTGYIV